MPQTPESTTPASTLSAPDAAKSRKLRPRRIKLSGSVLMLVRLPNQRQIRANVHQLSLTGGLLHVEKPLDEKIKVELIFQLGNTAIREQAEMLFPMWATHGWLQPFRFIELPEASKQALHASLQSFVQSRSNRE
jgi:hypothetical protein